MKLEPKYLAPYLPYALKCRWNNSDSKELVGLQYGNESVNNALWTWKDGNKYYTGYLYQCKPILFSLSSLTKEITVNGETFVPIDFINKNIRKVVDIYLVVGEINIDIETDNYSQIINLIDGYEIMQKLIEWKFDVFRLIELGLAEPVTEDFNPYK